MSEYIKYKEPLTHILAKPACGWSTFNMHPFQGRVSYIDDVTTIILNAMEDYKNHHECMMSFDEEGSEFHVIIKPYVTFIIHETNEAKLYAYEIDAHEVLKTLANDIRKNINEWASFAVLYEPDEPEYVENFNKNLEKIREVLNNMDAFWKN